MTEAVSELFLRESALFRPPLLTAGNLAEAGVDNFFDLPALSNLPSGSIYAGLNVSLPLVELFMHNNSFGTVSCMLPIEV